MVIKIGCVTHFYNEELLLPGWINWHREMFDFCYLLDHSSTDRSAEIIKELAPPNWKIIPSRLTDFDASANDREVSETENLMKDVDKPDWIITLNTTELIFTPLIRERIEAHSKLAPDIQAFGMRSVCLVDLEPNDSLDVLEHGTGYVDYENDVNAARRWRYIHNWLWGKYHLGRHATDLVNTTCPELLITYWQFAPFPNCKKRKQQINSRRSPHDLAVGNGVQHGNLADDEGFQRVYQEEAARSFNLLDFPLYKEYYDYWKSTPQ